MFRTRRGPLPVVYRGAGPQKRALLSGAAACASGPVARGPQVGVQGGSVTVALVSVRPVTALAFMLGMDSEMYSKSHSMC